MPVVSLQDKDADWRFGDRVGARGYGDGLEATWARGCRKGCGGWGGVLVE
jgi:hypothetical protein